MSAAQPWIAFPAWHPHGHVMLRAWQPYHACFTAMGYVSAMAPTWPCIELPAWHQRHARWLHSQFGILWMGMPDVRMPYSTSSKHRTGSLCGVACHALASDTGKGVVITGEQLSTGSFGCWCVMCMSVPMLSQHGEQRERASIRAHGHTSKKVV
eukprot:365990-Chlamydomonas_euryale.AAC.35